MTRRSFGVFLSLGFLLSACSAAPAPVPVKAGADELRQLAGKWEGEYSSQATGRSGLIVFELAPGEGHARGDVMMVPRGRNEAYRPSGSPGPNATRSESQLLSIRFVSAAQGMVTGTLDPYRDPDCDCDVETTFTGKLAGDTIEGSFSSVSSRGAGRTGGRWRVTRQRS